MDRAGISAQIDIAIVTRRANGQPVALERYRRAKAIGGVQRRDRQILAARKPKADPRLQRRLTKGRVVKAEQINPALADTGRADGEAVAVERNASAEQHAAGQPGGREVFPAGIAKAQNALLHRGRKQAVGKGEEIDRTRLGRVVRGTVVACGPDRQAIAIQRHRNAEAVANLQPRDRQILAADITVADDRLQRWRRKIGVGKAEQIDRTRCRRDIAKAMIGKGPNRQPVAVERHRRPKGVVCLQLAEREILAAAIARPDNRLEHRRAEIQIREGEEIDRTRPKGRVEHTAVVARSDREPQPVERDRFAKLVAGCQLTHPRAGQGVRESIEHQIELAWPRGRIGDGDVLGIEQQGAAAHPAARGFHRAAPQQIFGTRHLNEAAIARDRAAHRFDGAEEGRFFIRPYDNVAASAALRQRRHVDGHGIGRDQPPGVGELVGRQPLAALKFAADAHPPAAHAALRIKLRRKQVEPRRSDVNLATKTHRPAGPEGS